MSISKEEFAVTGDAGNMFGVTCTMGEALLIDQLIRDHLPNVAHAIFMATVKASQMYGSNPEKAGYACIKVVADSRI